MLLNLEFDISYIQFGMMDPQKDSSPGQVIWAIARNKLFSGIEIWTCDMCFASFSPLWPGGGSPSVLLQLPCAKRVKLALLRSPALWWHPLLQRSCMLCQRNASLLAVKMKQPVAHCPPPPPLPPPPPSSPTPTPSRSHRGHKDSVILLLLRALPNL